MAGSCLHHSTSVQLKETSRLYFTSGSYHHKTQQIIVQVGKMDCPAILERVFRRQTREIQIGQLLSYAACAILSAKHFEMTPSANDVYSSAIDLQKPLECVKAYLEGKQGQHGECGGQTGSVSCANKK